MNVLFLKVNTHFMRKIPAGAEASNILVGEVDFLDKTLSAFIRLSQASIMGDLTEVPVPTRFIFILLGPTVSEISKLLHRILPCILITSIFVHLGRYHKFPRNRSCDGNVDVGRGLPWRSLQSEKPKSSVSGYRRVSRRRNRTTSWRVGPNY